MNISYRATVSVLAMTCAALLAPSLAHAKRMGGSKSVRPASIGKTAPAPAPVAAPTAARPATPAAAAP
ncbi:MAG: ABC transporter substrate-binding protein, partial [Comamonas sp.]